MNTDLKIGILGAGIGGLITAIALRQRGFNPTVYEQTSKLGDVGAGITITANASKVFDALGMGEAFASIEKPTPHIGARHHLSGKTLFHETIDAGARQQDYGGYTRHVHRADMHNMLAECCQREGVSIELDHRLADISQDDSAVQLKFEQGQEATYDLVIACDGLKSVAREQLFSPEPAHFTGFVAWRGLVDRQQLADIDMDPHFLTYSSEDKLFARYPVRQGSLVNYVAIARKTDFRSESWHETADVSEVIAEFRGWHEEVERIISATPDGRCMRWALYTRQPLTSWIKNRVCLLGDAAHPMTPFYGMGAAMAIEDGLVLARCLEAEHGAWQKALERYQIARLERGNTMQRMSLDRAESYMNPSSAEQAKSPAAGAEAIMRYDPVTAPI